MHSKQRIEIIDGVKTAVVDGYDTGDRIYTDTINGIYHSDLKIGNYDVEKLLPEHKYVFYAKVYQGDVYVPIRVNILNEIHKTQDRLEEHRKTKIFIKEQAKELEKNLQRAIVYMKKVEKLYSPILDDKQDEYLNVLRVKDGCKEEREVARKSYEGILKYTQKTLDSMSTRYDSENRDIITNCIKILSNILQKRGIKDYRAEAIFLMKGNDLDETGVY